ncbi:MAG: DUF502 domain-containing protein, partial [bacterium]|nr:DUF502 domain-containing protein [bacterium]
LKRFFKTTLLGGVIVVLPMVLTFFFLRWLFNFITGLIEPLTLMVMQQSQVQKYIAIILVLAVIISFCFLIGLAVKTRMGRFIYQTIEKRLLKEVPGYNLFKETIKQILGKERAPFSRVALVRVFENSVMMTGFVTDEHPDGYYTVYVPGGLNPTTGLIYHLEKQYVHLVDVPVEDAMRSVISCGGGSQALLENYLKKSGKTAIGK